MQHMGFLPFSTTTYSKTMLAFGTIIRTWRLAFPMPLLPSVAEDLVLSPLLDEPAGDP